MNALVLAGGIVILLSIGLPAGYMEWQSRRHLSALGEQNPWFVYFLGPFAGQQYFTRDGWRYRRRATQFGLLSTAVFVALVLLLGW